MANLKIYLTTKGYNTLLTKGLLNEIHNFKVSDSSIIYGITDGVIKNSFYEVKLSAKDGVTGIPICSMANATHIPVNELTSNEINQNDSRIKINFVSESCLVPFEKSNLNVKVNVEKWIDNLLALKSQSYSRNMSGIKLNIFDYINAKLEKYDLVSKSWDVVDDYKKMDVSYSFKSDKDLKTFSTINNKYMNYTDRGEKVFVNTQSKLKFHSPLTISFGSKSIDGVEVYGVNNSMSLSPKSWGYLIPNDSLGSLNISLPTQQTTFKEGVFVNSSFVEENINSINTVYPAMIIDNTVYTMKDSKQYTTVDGVGSYVYAFKDSSGKTAIDGLTDSLKLFMKANGTEISNGVYEMVINLKLDLKADKLFNLAYQNNKIGGNLTLTLGYNENLVNTELYEIIE
jgi:hypothetical protein